MRSRIPGRNATPAKDESENFAPRFSFVCGTSENSFTKLRISKAYANLLRMPVGDTRMISLAWIGNNEIRMHQAPRTYAADEPLFLIELLDHDAQTQLDSRV
jgi:hypothetical protein